MAGSHLEPKHSRSDLRKEAQTLLNEAIRLEAPETRKQLLAGSFELIQRAEMMSELPEASTLELPPLPRACFERRSKGSILRGGVARPLGSPHAASGPTPPGGGHRSAGPTND